MFAVTVVSAILLLAPAGSTDAPTNAKPPVRGVRGGGLGAVRAVTSVAPSPKASGPRPEKKPEKKTDVLLPFSTPVPAALVPVKPGAATKVKADLSAALKIGPLSPVSAVCFSPDGKSLLVG